MCKLLDASRTVNQGSSSGKDNAILVLQNFILQNSHSALFDAINERIPNTEDAVELILGFLQSCKSDSVDLSDKEKLSYARYNLIKHAIYLLSSSDIDLSTSLANTLISALNTNIGYISTPKELFNIAETAVESFQSNARSSFYALDIIPTTFTIAQATIDTSSTSTTQAADVVNSIISRICSHAWPSSTIAHVLSALRAFPLTKESTLNAIHQATTLARTADIQDLPAIAHQLLLLAESSSCRESALQELIRLFDRLEKSAGITSNPSTAYARLIEVEAAVLMHLEMTIKHDVDLGMSWVRQIKSPGWTPTPFSFALSFVVAGVPRHEQQVLVALRDRLLKSHSDIVQIGSSPWLLTSSSVSTTVNDGGGDTHNKNKGMITAAAHNSNTINNSNTNNTTQIEHALMKCLANSGHGQAIGAQPIVSLAILLLEHSITTNNPTSATHASTLGINMLVQTFGSHKSSRKNILSTCSARLIGVSDRASAPFVRALGALVRCHPHIVESYTSEVRIALENLILLPPTAALHLLEVIWPLCRSQRDVSDLVVMLLRKAMFHREVDARLIAARGFLYLITEELQCARSGSNNHSNTNSNTGNGSGHHHHHHHHHHNNNNNGAGGSSGSGGAGGSGYNNNNNNGMEQHAGDLFGGSQHIPVLSQLEAFGGAGGSGGASLLHELMGFLRRCLAQQPEVRRAVYQGIPAVIQADPAASESISELLLPHLATFCEQNEMMTPPLKLEACARLGQDGVVRLIEPLHDLLVCVRAVVGLIGKSSSLRLSKKGGNNNKSIGYTSSSDDDDDDNDHMHDDNNTTNINTTDEDEAASAMLRTLFASLRRRLCSCPLEDFCFDQSTIFSTNEPQGELHQAHASMLLGAYEVCMEDIIDQIDQCTDARGRIPPGRDSKEVHRRCEEMAKELLSLFRQHRRLTGFAMDGIKASGGKKGSGSGSGGGVDGLSQALGARNTNTTNTTATTNNKNKKTAQNTTAKNTFSLDKRVSVLSLQCLARLLDAIVDDGLVAGGCDVDDGGQSAHVELARSAEFQAFVMTSSVHAISSMNSNSNGNSANNNNNDMAVATIAAPLLRAIHTIVLACAQQRGTTAAAQSKKDKDPSEQLMFSSIIALDHLVRSSCSSVGDLAALLQHVPSSSSSSSPISSKHQHNTNNTTNIFLISDRLVYFKQLLQSLVSNACIRELDILCNCLMTSVLPVVPPRTASLLASWVDSIVLSSPQALAHHHNAAKALLSLQLCCHAASGSHADFDVLSLLGQRICDRVNIDDGAATGMSLNSVNFSVAPDVPLLSSDTVNALMLAAVAHIDASLPALEWAIGHMKAISDTDPTHSTGIHMNSTTTTNNGGHHHHHDHQATNSFAVSYDRAEWERCTFTRMQSLIKAVHTLVSAQLRGPPMEALAKVLTKIFKVLGVAAKSQLAGRGQVQCAPGKAFQDLANSVNVELTPQVYAFITEVEMETGAAAAAISVAGAAENDAGNTQGDDDGEKGKKASKAKKKVVKGQRDISARIIPSLVYQVEEWEKHLIRVSKAGKLNLMLNAKRATNRDFRIAGGAVKKQRG